MELSGERRHVTVLFADMAGFTAISERLGEEGTFALIQPIYELMARAVQEQGGSVKDFTGDGIMALFGAPEVLEDAPLRACRAALLIYERLAAVASAIEAKHGVRPQMRIGISSGLAVVTRLRGESGPVTALGDTVNLAARLQTLAEPGTVNLSETTQRLVRGLVEATFAGARVIKGKAEPQKVYRLDALRQGVTRFEAAVGRGLSPYVGRERELELLERTLAEARGELRVIDIVAEPGMGKSRLLHEFCRRSGEAQARIWSGSCWPGDEQVPLRPFIEMMRRAFGIDPADIEREIAGKLETNLAVLGLATPENLGLLLNLLGIEPPAGALRGLDDVLVGLRTRDLLLTLVREGCRARPAVIILEDLHWMDGASRDLLALIVAIPDGTLAIVHTRRPAYVPPWTARANTTTLRLEPLAAGETAQIVEARLGVSELTGALGRIIIDRAEGNPLFAEEIANFLREERMVQKGAAGLEYDAAAVAAAVPASVQSLLTQRADRLPPADRSLLQAAAVIGRRFPSDLLAAVTPSTDVAARLGAMEALDLIRRVSSSEEFTFKHALGRDALYASLLSGPRQALHLAIAREIEARNAGRLSEVADTLAHHFARADHKRKAVEYLALVGRKSLGIYSLEEAEHSLRSALTIARSEDSERMDREIATIMVDLAVVYYLQFRSAETITFIEPELLRINKLGDAEQVPILLDLYGVALFTSCRFREAKRMADKALAIAERLGNARALAHARAGVIMMSIYIDPTPLGDFERFARQAYVEAEQAETGYMVVRMTMVIAMNYLHRGLTREGRRWAHQLMKVGRDREDRRSLGMALWLLGWFETITGEYEAALAHGEECIATALAPYDRYQGQLISGIAKLLLGRVAEGVAMLGGHRAHAIANGWQYAALAAQAPLGVALLLGGDLRNGVRVLEALIDRVESELGYRAYADWTRIFLAEFYIAILQGEKKPSLRVVLKNLLFLATAKRAAAKRAEALLRCAMENPQFSEHGAFRARIDFNLGILLKARGRKELALAHLRHGREAALMQEMPPLVAKIDVAIASM